MTSKKKPAEKKKKTTGSSPIQKDILIGELLEKYPETGEALARHGFHCIGCMLSPYETLEAGAAVHGIPLTPLLADLNKIITAKISKKATK